MPVLIIAEAGVNHNGDLATARQMVEVAARAGADIVKFQTFVADRLATRYAAKADYQAAATARDESQHAMLRRLELTPAMHEELIAHARQHQIGFLSTAFDIESLDLLASLGIDRIKVPSGELTNLPYLRHVGRCRLPVLLSTGMSNLDEVRQAIQTLEAAGTSRSQITVLQCNTEYPTAFDDANLAAMATMRSAFGIDVGYSDHTPGIEASIAAVALGATVIEKHFTLDRSQPGPDHQASLTGDELASLVRAIRHIERAIGDGVKRPAPGELKNRAVARKSLVAAAPIRAGEAFTERNLTVKRPGTGLSPMRWDEVLGKTAPRDFAADELIEL